MPRLRLMACLAIALAVGPASAARAADRPAERILKDIDEVERPTLDDSRRSDPEYIRQFGERASAAAKRKAELIGELYRADPDNPRLAKLMPERWTMMDPKTSSAEAEEILTRSRSEDLKKEAAYKKAEIIIYYARPIDPEVAAQAIEEFRKLAPKDDRHAYLLMQLGHQFEDGSERSKALFRRVIEEYPGSPDAELARGILHRMDAIGKPFELAFTDAISGKQVSIKALKGKVVVLDFWATWCGPCVAEIPALKRLYAEYKDKGVEFIGVSLDLPKERGGLDRLKAFVAANEVSWPQYYQGHQWDGEFSSSWGIDLVPTVFLIDQEGKLVSTHARGKLEKMIPELLEKARTKAGPSSGD